VLDLVRYIIWKIYRLAFQGIHFLCVFPFKLVSMQNNMFVFNLNNLWVCHVTASPSMLKIIFNCEHAVMCDMCPYLYVSHSVAKEER
jgi:hypothetical protein